MNYYILKPAVGTKETGQAYPAVENAEDYNFKAPNSVHKIKFNQFPDFTPDLRFKMAKGAKLCDMLGQGSINANGFLISERLRKILENVNATPYKFYPASIEVKGKFHKYYWMQLVWNEGLSLVDFKRTNFKITEFGTVLGVIAISSYEDLCEKQKELGFIKMIYAAKIVMKDPKLDLWPNPINTGIMVSPQVRLLLEQNNLTGIAFEENNTILFN